MMRTWTEFLWFFSEDPKVWTAIPAEKAMPTFRQPSPRVGYTSFYNKEDISQGHGGAGRVLFPP